LKNDLDAETFKEYYYLKSELVNKQHQISLIKKYIEKAKKGDFM